MASARVLAQAKINLFLRILAREVSGYHQLETLYCRLSLGDQVTVRATDGARSLHCTGERLPDGGLGPADQNLAWRAAAAYAQQAEWPRGFAIDPTGRTMIVSGEKSETISVYAIDPASGALSLRQKYPTGKGSNWVEIVSFD